MNELTMEERQNDVWADKDNQMFVVILMYSVGSSQPRFITSSKMKYETAIKKMEDMLNAKEQGRMVCLNSHFVNPDYVICIKLDVWKEKNANRFSTGYFYE